jgi:hypothetical protein
MYRNHPQKLSGEGEGEEEHEHPPEELANSSFKPDAGEYRECSDDETVSGHESSEDDVELNDNVQTKRQRHAPRWHEDYVRF